MTERTDRELLELAAKAAGTPGYYHDVYKGILADSFVWNPLTNDGDALRLAVKLNIDTLGDGKLQDGQPCMSVIFPLADDYDCLSEIVREGDDYAAIRRAIVRAAAEIGAKP